MTGAGVCCDPISWFKAGIIKQPSMFLLGLPAIGKSTFVRREVLGLSALGMNAIIPGDLKPDYASLVNMLGGQVIRLGAGIGVVNPWTPATSIMRCNAWRARRARTSRTTTTTRAPRSWRCC